MGMFDKIKEASVTEGGQYVLPGMYRAQINYCKQKTTRKGIGMVAVELRVLESTNPDRPVGSDMSWVVTMDKDAAMGNVKQFIAAVMGIDPKEVDVPGAEMIFSEANPLKGKFIRISAFNKPTKEGKDFTRVWFVNDSEGATGALKAHENQSSGKVEGQPTIPAPEPAPAA